MNFLRRTRLALAGVFCAFMLTVPGGSPRALSTELVVADQRSGIALYGFDPVSYYLLGRAEMGSQDIQLKFTGVTWQFRSEANREAFRAQPDVYVPRFGGYDPVALTRGAPVPGHPALFVIHDGRLYLFQKPENREAFIAAPQTTIEAARSFWPNARRSLVH
jgi:YHS domain-containing protein